MARQKFAERKLYLTGTLQRDNLLALVRNLPLDAENPLEVVIREKTKARGLDANARMWAGPLRDIAEQAWLDGRQYSALIWHEYFKGQLLPNDDQPEADPTNGYVKDGYRKWDFKPDGEPVLVGSTTELTKRGFADYNEQIHAFGANLGVRFSAPPQERK